jgi:hypothetical protein
MFRLYELSAAMQEIESMLEESAAGVEGKLEALEGTLEALELSFSEKVESIIKLMKAKQGEAAIIAAERDRLDKLAKSVEREAQWLHAYIEREMRNAELLEVKSPLFRIKMNMTPPRVEVVDKDLIPDKYMRYRMVETNEPDKMAIKEAIANGEVVEGVVIKQDLKLKIG